MAISINGREFVLQRAEDYIRDKTEDVKYLKPTKEQERIAQAQLPSLLK